MTVALSAARQFGVKLDSLHLDSSSFHVDGEYLQPQQQIVEPGAIHITHGYSRDHRPDFEAIYRRSNVQWGWRHSLVLESRGWK